MANITIQNLEVESTALNQVSAGEMEKVVGGLRNYLPAIGAIAHAQVLSDLAYLLSKMYEGYIGYSWDEYEHEYECCKGE